MNHAADEPVPSESQASSTSVAEVPVVRLNDDGTAKSSRRLARPSNEPEADPLLGGFFIGDYIEVFAHDRTAWVAYNANYRSRAAAVRGSPDPAARQTTWPRCGCSCRLARSEEEAPLDRGLHPSLSADGGNARGA